MARRMIAAALATVLAAMLAGAPLLAGAPERSPVPAPRPLSEAAQALAAARPMPRPAREDAEAQPSVIAAADAPAAAPAGAEAAEVALAPTPETAAAPAVAADVTAAAAVAQAKADAADHPARNAAEGEAPEAVAEALPPLPVPPDARAIPLAAYAAAPAIAPEPVRSLAGAARIFVEPRPAPVVVHAAVAGQPRPAPRPEGDGVEIPTRAVFAPMELAVRPAPRPEGLVAAPAAAAPAALSTRAVVAAISPLAVDRSRLPRLRPEAERRRFVQRVAAVRTQPAPGVTGRASGQLCGVAGIEGTTIAPVVSNVQGCGVPEAVRVSAVDGVRLSQSAIMDCGTARALHGWVRNGLRPAVGRLGGGPVELRVAAHYVCRTRNHRPGARISEHGRGRAIDISAVRLAGGQTMSVLQHWRHATYGPVLRAAHRAACGPFSTTLGPGSDGMHEDHFHFDTRRGRQYCR